MERTNAFPATCAHTEELKWKRRSNEKKKIVLFIFLYLMNNEHEKTIYHFPGCSSGIKNLSDFIEY
jgi:hypothetical protein